MEVYFVCVIHVIDHFDLRECFIDVILFDLAEL